MNALFLRPYGCPAGVDPAEWRKAVADRIEKLLDAIQALMAALDTMDGDPDLEPSLGYHHGELAMVDAEGGDPLDEGESNDWDGEENGDREYSLGWRTWAYLDDLAPALAEGWSDTIDGEQGQA